MLKHLMDAGGIADIVLEGKTALLADVQDARAFANHLLQLVQDDALRHRLGSTGQQHVAARYSYQRLMRDMSALYYQLLEKK